MRVLRYLRRFEPARLAALRTAVLALLAAAGITLTPRVDAWIGTGFAVATIVLGLIQGETTRRRVTPAGHGWRPRGLDE